MYVIKTASNGPFSTINFAFTTTRLGRISKVIELTARGGHRYRNMGGEMGYIGVGHIRGLFDSSLRTVSLLSVYICIDM